MRITIAVVFGVVALLVPGTASAAPPANDGFATATAVDIGSLPLTDVVDISEAGTEGGEINHCGVSTTVWYSFTPTSDAVIRLNPSGSSFYGPVLNLYRQTGSDLGGLSHMFCSTFGSQMTISAQAGTTYYVQAGSSYYGAGTLRLAMSLVQPPGNDDFANAESISSLPFSDSTDTTAGTTEGGEPIPSCSYTGQPAGSIWYRYTPAADGWVTASTFGSGPTTAFAAYTGDTLGSLTERGCKTQYGRLTLAVQAGQTYSFYVGGLYGVKGNIAFQLDVAPSPNAQFGRSVYDPSAFDTIQFYNWSWDPGEVGISSHAWDFGDGTGSTDPSPTHRYASDGTYTVSLTVTTLDGRTGTTSQTFDVKTHDVAIVRLATPNNASAGQTKSINASVANRRYDESVRVDLYRSVPGGYELVGSLTQSAPARSGGRTTEFRINYTFTSADAALGKVTFKAIATIVGARDALGADNEAIGAPTKVNG